MNSPDNIEVCLACQIIGSTNYYNILNDHYRELTTLVDKLSTPSKVIAKKHYESNFNELLNTGLITETEPIFNDFQHYLTNFLKKGFLFSNIKCQTCQYTLFKKEGEVKCLKCLYAESSFDEEIYLKKYAAFIKAIQQKNELEIENEDFKTKYGVLGCDSFCQNPIHKAKTELENADIKVQEIDQKYFPLIKLFFI